MTRLFTALYVLAFLFAGQPGPLALPAAAFGPCAGFLALAFALRRLTTKGSAHA